MRILKILLFLHLFYTTVLFSNQNLANEASGLAASAVYDLDTQRLEILFKPFLEKNKNLQGIQIFDAISGNLLFQSYKNKNKVIFQKTLPKPLQSLSKMKTKIVYNDEIVGNIILYYEEIIRSDDATKLNPLALSQKEKEWLDKNPIQRVAIMSYWPHDGKNNSLHTEILKLINEAVGTNLTPIVFNAWKDGYGEAMKGENLHGIMGLSWSQEREKEYFFYSQAYNFTPCYLVTKKNNTTIQSIKDLENKTIYLKKDEITHKMLEGKNLKIIDLEKIEDMIISLGRKNEAEAFVSYFINEEEVKKHNLKVQDIIYDKYGEVAIGIHHKYPELHSILNKAYKIIPKEKIAKLRNIDWEKKDLGIEDEKINEISFIGILTLKEGMFFIFLSLLLLCLFYLVYSKSNILNIKFKFFNFFFISSEIAIILFIIFEVVVLDRTENMLAKAYKDRGELFKTINELKQSSNDLTHFARTYAVTSNEEFKTRYFTILDIMNGKVPRPKGYEGVYWDLDKDGREAKHPNEKQKALKEIVEALPFSSQEKEKLELSENNSNNLVLLEKKAFEAMEKNNPSLAIALLHSQEYYQAKQIIMEPIDEVILLLEERTNREIEILDQTIKVQFKYILTVGILFILGNFLAFILLRNKITKPIEYLTHTINAFNSNDYNIEKKQFYNDEIGYMIEQFFKMKESIDEKTNSLEQSKKDIEQILSNILLPILITSRSKKTILYANKYAEQQYEMRLDEIIGSEIDNVYTLLGQKDDILNAIKKDGYVANMEQKFKTNSGRKFDALLSVTPIIYQDEPSFIGMITDITKQKMMEQEIRQIHKHTRDSIEYAALIQTALIPENNLFRKYFDDYFVIWHPKDIVGGDIYLLEKLRHDEECLLMVIDCTGHGVPGAFVTMLVKAIEREIVSKINHNENEIVSPAQILSIFNKSMKHLLKQEDKASIANAGFDGQVVYFNKKEKILKCASAKNTMFYLQEGKIEELKGDKQSVGYNDCDSNFKFTEYVIDISKDTTVYLSTDGYWDQMGGEHERSFGKKRFRNLIESVKNESMAEQQEEFIYTLKDYQDNIDRQDDITVIAFKIKGE